MTDSDETERASWIDLASERVDGEVLWANDDFFAEKENLVRAAEAIWDADRYTDRGKWMDGWESRRRREPGHDEAIVRLGLPGMIHELVIDTAFFTGNFPESASVEACWAPSDISAEELLDPEGEWGSAWFEILEKSVLEGGTKNHFSIASQKLVSHVRLHIYPDGGVARLRVLGEVLVELPTESFDLAALVHGGSVVDASDRYFSAPENLLLPHASTGMHDGWETRRRRGPGNDWVILRLGAPGEVERVVVDTSHFKGNAPGWFSLECLPLGEEPETAEEESWSTLVSKTDLQPDREHVFGVDHPVRADCLRFQIYPDGGVARLRLFGAVDEETRLDHSVTVLDHLPEAEARRRLIACCGSSRWAETMSSRRPFETRKRLHEVAARVWGELDRVARLEAFRTHPRIGDRDLASDPQQAAGWARGEQSGVESAEEETLTRLKHGNRRYEERFEHVFLVCATGKNAAEMLELLEARIGNEPDEEFEIASAEQLKITQLRLDKLLAG